MTGSSQSGNAGGRLDPPAPFRRTASGVLKITRGGGAISLFGAPFFLAGLFMLLSAAGAVPARTESGGSEAILIPMGLVFLTVGGVMVFGRQWLVLDLGRRSLVRQIRLVVPVHTDERALSEFHAVVISHSPGDSESAETYPVTLRASTGKDAAIVKPLQYGESLATAEYLARALSLQLVDATTDREIAVSPERAGECLRDRLSRTPAGAAPPRPASMRSDIKESGGETRIEMPGGGPTLAGYAGVFLPMMVFCMVMLFSIPFLMKTANPLRLFLMLLLLFGAPTLFTSVRYMILGKRKGVTVRVSSAGVVIERAGGGKARSTTIAAEDVFDVDYSTQESAIASARVSTYGARAAGPVDERVLGRLRKLIPNPGITIKARSGLTTIGEGLSADELQYLVWVMRTALVGGTQGLRD